MIVGSFVFAQRPSRRTRARMIPFESGVSQGPLPQQRFTISFYLTALLFIVFDIEIVFLYPLAVVLRQLAWFGFVELLFFVAILVVAYVYVWRKGALEWQLAAPSGCVTTASTPSVSSGAGKGPAPSSR